MSKPLKLRYVNQVVGSFVLLIAVLLLVILIMLARRQEWFAPTYQLYAIINEHELDGLRRGAEVYLLGKKVGEVSSIVYRDEGRQLTVTLRIRQTYQEEIFDDSVAYIRRRLAGAGEAFIEVMRGAHRRRPKEHGEEIELAVEHETTQDLERVVGAMESIQQSFEDVRNSMVPAFDKMARTVDNLDESNRKLSAVLDDLQEVSPRIDPLVDETEEILDGSQDVVDNLRDETEELSGTSRKLKDSLDGAQEVIDGLKSHWLLRRFIDPPRSEEHISPSHVDRGGGWH